MNRSDARSRRFLDACRGKPTDCTPVWLMRQAGRYQPSYRGLRKDVPFFELCRHPELAAQVTVNAVEELGVDAGIIFSDIQRSARRDMRATCRATPQLAAAAKRGRDDERVRTKQPNRPIRH